MSTGLIIIGCILLIIIVVVQIGRVTELAAKIRGEEEVQLETNRRNGMLMLLFLIGFLIYCFWSAIHYKNWMLGYGPHQAASAHGDELDSMFNTTLIFTGIVFVITHIALFWFAYKYRGRRDGKVAYIAHDNKLEVIWTAIPAVVMCFLVIRGLVTWNEVMADVSDQDEYIEVEATGSQFLWYLRYPGSDGLLGTRDYRLITAKNPLGQDWNDEKNLDDFQPNDLVLPVGKKVRVRIMARDVLHSFYLPHFRVKMDAIPGLPTYFVFTPSKTTEEYRQELRKYPEYQQPTDPTDPNSEPLWKTFNYEMACAELCGKGHFSMKKIVRIVSEEEYQAWQKEQQSYYRSTILGTDEDPLKGELSETDTTQRQQDFELTLEKALAASTPAEKVVRLDFVFFEPNSHAVSPQSSIQLDRIIEFMNKYPTVSVEVDAYSGELGTEGENLSMSNLRADAVKNYLTTMKIAENRITTKGFSLPAEAPAPETQGQNEGQNTTNSRIELKIIAQQ